MCKFSHMAPSLLWRDLQDFSKDGCQQNQSSVFHIASQGFWIRQFRGHVQNKYLPKAHLVYSEIGSGCKIYYCFIREYRRIRLFICYFWACPMHIYSLDLWWTTLFSSLSMISGSSSSMLRYLMNTKSKIVGIILLRCWITKIGSWIYAEVS